MLLLSDTPARVSETVLNYTLIFFYLLLAFNYFQDRKFPVHKFFFQKIIYYLDLFLDHQKDFDIHQILHFCMKLLKS